MFLARTALLIGSLDAEGEDEVEEEAAEMLEEEAAVATREFFAGFPLLLLLLLFMALDEVEEREAAACCIPAIPHRGDSFMCRVISCKLRKLSLHQTQVKTSLVCSLLRLIH